MRSPTARAWHWLGSRDPFLSQSIVAISGIAIPILTYLLDHVKAGGRSSIGLLIAVTICTLVVLVVPWARSSEKNRQIREAQDDTQEARAQLRTTFGDAIEPVFQQLAQMASERGHKKAERWGFAVSLLLNATQKLAGAGRIRATFFLYEPAEGDEPERLTPQGSAGRSVEVRHQFRAGTPLGDKVINMVKRREIEYKTNVIVKPPDEWSTGKPSEYDVFLSVPVVSGHDPKGLLNIDSTDPEDVDEDDVELLRMIASIFALMVTVYRK